MVTVCWGWWVEAKWDATLGYPGEGPDEGPPAQGRELLTREHWRKWFGAYCVFIAWAARA